MFNLASQTFIFSKEFTCVFYIFWEINDRIWRVTKALRIRGFRVSFKFTKYFLIITWLWKFSFFCLLYTNGTLPGKYVFLPIPKDTRICFGLKWISQTIFRFTKFISSCNTPISFKNLRPFLTQCWIFWQFKKYNTSFYSICIIKGTLTSRMRMQK